jgi:O-antigen/teichoic acid export membrane protein
MLFSRIKNFLNERPARAGALAGWYQQACGISMALISIPLVMKLLDPSDAGLWFSFQSLLAVVVLADFGLTFVITRQVAYSLHSTGAQSENTDFIETRPGWEGVADIYRASRKLFYCVAVIGLAVWIVLYHGILPMGKLLEHATGSTMVAWYLMGFATLLTLQTKPDQSLIEGMAKIFLTRCVVGTFQLVSGLGVIVILLVGGKLMAMAGMVFATALLQFFVLKFLVHHVTEGKLSSSGTVMPDLQRRFLKVAVPMGILNLSGFLVSSVQVPFIGFFLGPELVPGFFLAQKIGQTLNLLLMQIVAPQMPLFTQELARGDRDAAAYRMRRTLKWITGLAFLANVAFCAGTLFLAEFWIGKLKYLHQNLLIVMSIDYFLMTFAVVWCHFVFASGRNPFVWTTLISGCLNVLGCIFLGERFGMMGIALSGLISGLVLNYWFAPWYGLNLLKQLQASPRVSAPVCP